MIKAHELIAKYNDILLPYQEADEYALYRGVPIGTVLARIKAGVENANRRRSRRYRVDIPVSYTVLSDPDPRKGRLLDLSVHGCLLQGGGSKIFNEYEQLKVHIPAQSLIPTTEGDFLTLSAKVRRVFISGEKAGLSFEYMTERQIFNLTNFLLEMVSRQVTRKSQQLQQKWAREQGR